LARQYETGQARARKFFELRGEILATAILRVDRASHIVMEFAYCDWLVAVPLPPDREKIGRRLAAAIPLLRLAHSPDGVVAQRQ
jgi:hypothetical protein